MQNFNMPKLCRILALAVRDSREVALSDAEIAQVVGAMMEAGERAVNAAYYSRAAAKVLATTEDARFMLSRKRDCDLKWVMLSEQAVGEENARKWAERCPDGMARIIPTREQVELMRNRNEIAN